MADPEEMMMMIMRLRETMEMVVTILDGKLERKIFFFFPLSEDASLF